MPEKSDIYHSILIVSVSDSFVSVVKKSLTGFFTADTAKSTALARRYLLERYYDLIVVNMPLPDESGEKFALDAAGIASVLLVTPQEMFEEVLADVTDEGILVLPKPLPRGRIEKAIRFLASIQNRMHSLEKRIMALEERMDDLRIMDRAKFLLMEHSHMTEDEAHRLIGKRAMDSGVSRGKAARKILDDME